MAAGKVDFVITYGTIPDSTDAFTIGVSDALPFQTGTSDTQKQSRRIIHSNDGPISISRNDRQFAIEFSFVTIQETAEDLRKEVQLIEQVFSQIRQAFTLTINGEEQYNFSHAAGTGFSSSARLEKRGSSDLDSGFSRNFRARIEVGLPADKNFAPNTSEGNPPGTEGLQTSSVDVSFGANHKRTVTINGQYTGLPAAAAWINPDDTDDKTETGTPYARDQFEDQIDDYCAAVLFVIGGEPAEFELTNQKASCDDSDLSAAGMAKGRVLVFSRTYEELFYSEGPNPEDEDKFDYSRITRQQFQITRKVNRSAYQSPSPKGNRYAEGMVQADATYSCSFDRSKMPDGDYPTVEILEKEWVDLRPWIIKKIKLSFDGYAETEQGAFFVLSENLSFNLDEYGISVLFTVAGMAIGKPPVSRKVTYDLTRQYGKKLTPIWDKNSAYARYVFQGAASRVVSMTDQWSEVGDWKAPALEEPDWNSFAPKDGKNWKFAVLSRQVAKHPKRGGVVPDSGTFVDVTYKVTVEFYQDPGVGPARRPVTEVVGDQFPVPGAGTPFGGF